MIKIKEIFMITGYKVRSHQFLLRGEIFLWGGRKWQGPPIFHLHLTLTLQTYKLIQFSTMTPDRKIC